MKLLRDKIKRDTYMVSKLCGMIARNELRNDHPQQRKSGQWDKSIRDNFIVTVIKNEDFDPIKICEQLTEDGVVLWLIDGLQRSTTIENFKAGRFALGRKIDPYFIEYQETVKDEEGNITHKNIMFDLRGKSYKDLPEKLKEDFDNCPVSIVKHLDCSDEEIGRHIVRYNSGRPMVVAQKISAYMYNTAKYVKKLSGHAFFNDCANYSETADRNGTVDKVVSEAIMGLNFFESWNKQAQKIGEYLNNNATEEMFDNFSLYLDRLLGIITPETGKLFSAKNALVWFMLFDKFATTGRSDDEFQTFLEHYEEVKKVKVNVTHEYELIKNSGEYTNYLSFAELDSCKSTKDKGIIEDKLHILESVMNDFLHISDEQSCPGSVEEFIAENLEMDIQGISEEMDFYNESLDTLLENRVKLDSKLRHEQNRPSLLALLVYAYKEDTDIILEKWLEEYAKENNTYFVDQQKNLVHMKNNFEQWCIENRKSA